MPFIISTTGGTASYWLSLQFSPERNSSTCTHGGGRLDQELTPAGKEIQSRLVDHARGSGDLVRAAKTHQDFPDYLNHRNISPRLMKDSGIFAQTSTIEKSQKFTAGDVHGTSSPSLARGVEFLGGKYGYLIRNPKDRTLSKLRLKIEQIVSQYDQKENYGELYFLLFSAAQHYVSTLSSLSVSKENPFKELSEKLKIATIKKYTKILFEQRSKVSVSDATVFLRPEIASEINQGIDHVHFSAEEILVLAAVVEVSLSIAADREFMAFCGSRHLLKYEELTRDKAYLKHVLEHYSSTAVSPHLLEEQDLTKKENARPEAPSGRSVILEYKSLNQFIEMAISGIAEKSNLTSFYNSLGYKI